MCVCVCVCLCVSVCLCVCVGRRVKSIYLLVLMGFSEEKQLFVVGGYNKTRKQLLVGETHMSGN